MKNVLGETIIHLGIIYYQENNNFQCIFMLL